MAQQQQPSSVQQSFQRASKRLTELNIAELIDSGLCSAERGGGVNCDVLRTLLRNIVRKLGMEEEPAPPIVDQAAAAGGTSRLAASSSSSTGHGAPLGGYGAGGFGGLPNIARVPDDSTPPAYKHSRSGGKREWMEVEEQGGGGGAPLSANEAWQIIQLNNRLATAEQAIQRMASLMEDQLAGKTIPPMVSSGTQQLVGKDSSGGCCDKFEKVVGQLRKDIETLQKLWLGHLESINTHMDLGPRRASTTAVGLELDNEPSFMKPRSRDRLPLSQAYYQQPKYAAAAMPGREMDEDAAAPRSTSKKDTSRPATHQGGTGMDGGGAALRRSVTRVGGTETDGLKAKIAPAKAPVKGESPPEDSDGRSGGQQPPQQKPAAGRMVTPEEVAEVKMAATEFVNQVTSKAEQKAVDEAQRRAVMTTAGPQLQSTQGQQPKPPITAAGRGSDAADPSGGGQPHKPAVQQQPRAKRMVPTEEAPKMDSAELLEAMVLDQQMLMVKPPTGAKKKSKDDGKAIRSEKIPHVNPPPEVVANLNQERKQSLRNVIDKAPPPPKPQQQQSQKSSSQSQQPRPQPMTGRGSVGRGQPQMMPASQQSREKPVVSPKKDSAEMFEANALDQQMSMVKPPTEVTANMEQNPKQPLRNVIATEPLQQFQKSTQRKPPPTGRGIAGAPVSTTLEGGTGADGSPKPPTEQLVRGSQSTALQGYQSPGPSGIGGRPQMQASQPTPTLQKPVVPTDEIGRKDSAEILEANTLDQQMSMVKPPAGGRNMSKEKIKAIPSEKIMAKEASNLSGEPEVVAVPKQSLRNVVEEKAAPSKTASLTGRHVPESEAKQQQPSQGSQPTQQPKLEAPTGSGITPSSATPEEDDDDDVKQPTPKYPRSSQTQGNLRRRKHPKEPAGQQQPPKKTLEGTAPPEQMEETAGTESFKQPITSREGLSIPPDQFSRSTIPGGGTGPAEQLPSRSASASGGGGLQFRSKPSMLPPEDLLRMSPSKLEQLTPEQVLNMSSETFKAMSPLQRKAVNEVRKVKPPGPMMEPPSGVKTMTKEEIEQLRRSWTEEENMSHEEAAFLLPQMTATMDEETKEALQKAIEKGPAPPSKMGMAAYTPRLRTGPGQPSRKTSLGAGKEFPKEVTPAVAEVVKAGPDVPGSSAAPKQSQTQQDPQARRRSSTRSMTPEQGPPTKASEEVGNAPATRRESAKKIAEAGPSSAPPPSVLTLYPPPSPPKPKRPSANKSVIQEMAGMSKEQVQNLPPQIIAEKMGYETAKALPPSVLDKMTPSQRDALGTVLSREALPPTPSEEVQKIPPAAISTKLEYNEAKTLPPAVLQKMTPNRREAPPESPNVLTLVPPIPGRLSRNPSAAEEFPPVRPLTKEKVPDVPPTTTADKPRKPPKFGRKTSAGVLAGMPAEEVQEIPVEEIETEMKYEEAKALPPSVWVKMTPAQREAVAKVVEAGPESPRSPWTPKRVVSPRGGVPSPAMAVVDGKLKPPTTVPEKKIMEQVVVKAKPEVPIPKLEPPQPKGTEPLTKKEQVIPVIRAEDTGLPSQSALEKMIPPARRSTVERFTQAVPNNTPRSPDAAPPTPPTEEPLQKPRSKSALEPLTAISREKVPEIVVSGKMAPVRRQTVERLVQTGGAPPPPTQEPSQIFQPKMTNSGGIIEPLTKEQVPEIIPVPAEIKFQPSSRSSRMTTNQKKKTVERFSQSATVGGPPPTTRSPDDDRLGRTLVGMSSGEIQDIPPAAFIAEMEYEDAKALSSAVLEKLTPAQKQVVEKILKAGPPPDAPRPSSQQNLLLQPRSKTLIDGLMAMTPSELQKIPPSQLASTIVFTEAREVPPAVLEKMTPAQREVLVKILEDGSAALPTTPMRMQPSRKKKTSRMMTLAKMTPKQMEKVPPAAGTIIFTDGKPSPPSQRRGRAVGEAAPTPRNKTSLQKLVGMTSRQVQSIPPSDIAATMPYAFAKALTPSLLGKMSPAQRTAVERIINEGPKVDLPPPSPKREQPKRKTSTRALAAMTQLQVQAISPSTLFVEMDYFDAKCLPDSVFQKMTLSQREVVEKIVGAGPPWKPRPITQQEQKPRRQIISDCVEEEEDPCCCGASKKSVCKLVPPCPCPMFS